MKTILNRLMQQRSKVLAILLVVSLLMTSSTFAYWTSSIQGNTYTHSSYITIGDYKNLTDYLFLLSSEYATGDYQVNNEDFFTKTPTTHSFTNTFQAEWISEDKQEFEEYVVTADVTFDYVVRILDSKGAEVNKNKYNKLIDYISVEFDETNVTKLILNEVPETLAFSLHITEPSKKNHYNLFKNLTVSVVFSYEINGTTQEYIYTQE